MVPTRPSRRPPRGGRAGPVVVVPEGRLPDFLGGEGVLLREEEAPGPSDL